MELDLDQMSSQATDVRANAKAALNLAERGWCVLPLHYPRITGCSCGKLSCTSIAKHPMTRNGVKDASKSKIIVANWWNQNPFANIGIMTGLESNLVVLDVDPRHGGDLSLNALEKEFENLPLTLQVKTGGNGWHYYFQYPQKLIAEIIGNRTNMRPGLDIRAEGGYIVAPPSVHASKQNYSWVNPTQSIATLPNWLEKLILNKTTVNKTVVSMPKNNFLGEGNRNNGLCSIAGYLKSKGVEQNEIQKTLGDINQNLCQPPLQKEEVQKIVKSVARYARTEQANDCEIIPEKTWSTINCMPKMAATPVLTAELLPKNLRDWCVDIAERKQVPLEFVAGPCIVMIGSLIGRKAVVSPKLHDDWLAVPNLWGCVIAPPGSLKSPAISAVLKPLQNIARKAQRKYLETKKSMAKDQTMAITEIEALKDAFKFAIKKGDDLKIDQIKDKLDKALASFEEKFNLREPRYISSDSTIEKLLTILENNPQGLLIYRDELSGWLETMMHKSGREGDREFYLESWNGDNSYQMDRVGRGTTTVDAVCLSVMGGLQPGKFASYVASVAKGGKSDDGLLQRFQVIMFPDRRKKWKKVDRKPNLEAQKKVEEILERIDQMPLPQIIDDHVNRPIYYYSPAAQLLADSWHEKLENRLCTEKMSPLLEAHISKFRSLLPSLALIFTLVNDQGLENKIQENEVKLAIEWCNFLEGHAIKAYGEYIDPEMTAGQKLLDKIHTGLIQDKDRCRDIYRRGWKGLSSIEEFENATKALKKFGYIRIEHFVPVSGGRSEVIRLHPDLRK